MTDVTRRRRRWPARGLALVTLALLAMMVVVRETDPAGAVAVALGLGITAGIGSLVASRRPDHPTGWLLAGLAALAAASIVATDYVQSSASAGAPRAAAIAAWSSTWLATPLLPLGALLLLTFPTGRLPSPRWRGIALVAVGAGLVQAVMLAVTPGPVPVAPWRDNPLGVDPLGPVAAVAATRNAAITSGGMNRSAHSTIAGNRAGGWRPTMPPSQNMAVEFSCGRRDIPMGRPGVASTPTTTEGSVSIGQCRSWPSR